jgi:GGDEF domain-containing protein
MKAPAIPNNEPERIQALKDLEILYTPAEERFDRITRVARRVFDVPIALVSLVTDDQQWFKSCQGLTASATSREISFCGHAILNDDTFVVSNALKDPDFRDNPLVTEEPKIRFYAGQPLHFGNHKLGTLCLIDTRPRHLKPQDYDSLKCLAGWTELELMAWQNQAPSFLQQALKGQDREKLLDPVTGDLNDAGFALIKNKVKEAKPEQLEAMQILIDIQNIPDGLDSDSIDLLRKSIAQSVRSIVGEQGVLGSRGSDGFAVVLPEMNREQADVLVKRLDENTGDFIDKEFDLHFAKPQVSFQLATISEES